MWNRLPVCCASCVVKCSEGCGSTLGKLLNVFTLTDVSAELRPRKYKCGLSAPCPQKHLAFRLVSGSANVIGPKICLEDKM